MAYLFALGNTPMAIYSIVALGLAFFSFNRGLPLTIRSVFYLVIATLTGLTPSLGLGVSQLNAGLNHLFGNNINITIQVILIVVITGFATSSVVIGLNRGVKKLSEINIFLTGIFLLFVLIVGPTIYILSGFT